MLHAPRGELVATWLSIMTADARLERDPGAALAADGPGGAAGGPGGAATGPADPLDARRVALGLVVEASGTMRQQLKDAFCALSGGGLAAAVAEGQTNGWLIDSCEALAEAHRELPDADRRAIDDALRACRAAAVHRSGLERSVPMDSAGGPAQIEDIRGLGRELRRAGLDLVGAVRQALRPAAG
jgi:hypothetical protein